jgi:uncharacterized delta-60 repeat protein
MSILTSRSWSLIPLLVIPLTLSVANCDSDMTPNQTTGRGGSGGSTAGTSGSAGRGGAGGSGPAGMGGIGGAAGAAASAGRGGGGGTAGAAGATFVDTDVVLARFNANGTPDTSYGTLGTGVVRVDLGPGAMVGTGSVRDAPWSIARDGLNRVHVFAARKNMDRTDTDRVVVRVTPAGAVDTTFGASGFHTLNIGNVSDNARNGLVQDDGKIVSSGYYNGPTGFGDRSANRIVLARLHGGPDVAAGGTGGAAGAAGAGGAAGAAGAGGAAGAAGAGGAAGAAGAGGTAGPAGPTPGTLDTSFGMAGIVNSNPLGADPAMAGTAEAYGMVRQSTGAYVTAGYGRSATTGTVNVLSFRYSAAGVFDTSYGVNGIFEKDLTSDNDRGRNIALLPNDRLLIVGSATPTSMQVDGMAMILTANGALDTTFNTTGYKVYKFDATNDRPDEALYGAAVSPNNMFAAAVGYRNAGSVAGNNDDAVLVIIPLGGTGTEFAAAVPLSTTTADRFWAVTFDADNKIVAAGYVAEGSDYQLAVARFNTDGSPDTSFGTNGIAKLNAKVGGNLEEARGIVVQTDGKIVIGGSAEH